MYSILVVVNKHNTARVASCWFIIYYRLVMHGNLNIKKPRMNPCKMDGVQEDLKTSGVNNWKTKAANRLEWRSIVGAVKVATLLLLLLLL